MVATAISYEPFAGCFYNGDDPLQLMRQVPDLLAFHIEPREPFVPLADIDPYACNLRLRAISAGNRDEIAAIFRLVPDQVQIISIPPEALPAAEMHITTRRPVPDPQSHRGAMRIAARAGSNGRLGRLRWRGGTRGGTTPCVTAGICIWRIPWGAPALWRWRSTMPDHCCPRLNRHLRPSPSALNDGRRRRWPSPIPRQPPKDRPIACFASARRKSRPSSIWRANSSSREMPWRIRPSKSNRTLAAAKSQGQSSATVTPSTAW